MAIDLNRMRKGTELLKRGFAKMQEGGVIMDVVTPEQAHIAEDAGATSVMALERVPADIRADGGGRQRGAVRAGSGAGPGRGAGRDRGAGNAAGLSAVRRSRRRSAADAGRAQDRAGDDAAGRR